MEYIHKYKYNTYIYLSWHITASLVRWLSNLHTRFSNRLRLLRIILVWVEWHHRTNIEKKKHLLYSGKNWNHTRKSSPNNNNNQTKHNDKRYEIGNSHHSHTKMLSTNYYISQWIDLKKKRTIEWRNARVKSNEWYKYWRQIEEYTYMVCQTTTGKDSVSPFSQRDWNMCVCVCVRLCTWVHTFRAHKTKATTINNKWTDKQNKMKMKESFKVIEAERRKIFCPYVAIFNLYSIHFIRISLAAKQN